MWLGKLARIVWVSWPPNIAQGYLWSNSHWICNFFFLLYNITGSMCPGDVFEDLNTYGRYTVFTYECKDPRDMFLSHLCCKYFRHPLIASFHLKSSAICGCKSPCSLCVRLSRLFTFEVVSGECAFTRLFLSVGHQLIMFVAITSRHLIELWADDVPTCSWFCVSASVTDLFGVSFCHQLILLAVTVCVCVSLQFCVCLCHLTLCAISVVSWWRFAVCLSQVHSVCRQFVTCELCVVSVGNSFLFLSALVDCIHVSVTFLFLYHQLTGYVYH